MKAEQLTLIVSDVHNHALTAIFSLFKAANVGEEMLKLKNPVGYSDGAEYTITKIDCQFTDDPKYDSKELVFYQLEDDIDQHDGPQSVSGLPLETLLELLESVEETLKSYYNFPLRLGQHSIDER